MRLSLVTAFARLFGGTFREEEHPRANDGKFATKPGGGSGSSDEPDAHPGGVAAKERKPHQTVPPKTWLDHRVTIVEPTDIDRATSPKASQKMDEFFDVSHSNELFAARADATMAWAEKELASHGVKYDAAFSRMAARKAGASEADRQVARMNDAYILGVSAVVMTEIKEKGFWPHPDVSSPGYEPLGFQTAFDDASPYTPEQAGGFFSRYGGTKIDAPLIVFSGSNYDRSRPIRQVAIHELGHAAHHRASPAKMASLSAAVWAERRGAVPLPPEHPGARPEMAGADGKPALYLGMTTEIAQAVHASDEISGYGRTNALEFVAEVYAALVGGETFSEPILAAYDALGGFRPKEAVVAPKVSAHAKRKANMTPEEAERFRLAERDRIRRWRARKAEAKAAEGATVRDQEVADGVAA